MENEGKWCFFVGWLLVLVIVEVNWVCKCWLFYGILLEFKVAMICW